MKHPQLLKIEPGALIERLMPCYQSWRYSTNAVTAMMKTTTPQRGCCHKRKPWAVVKELVRTQNTGFLETGERFFVSWSAGLYVLCVLWFLVIRVALGWFNPVLGPRLPIEFFPPEAWLSWSNFPRQEHDNRAFGLFGVSQTINPAERSEYIVFLSFRRNTRLSKQLFFFYPNTKTSLLGAERRIYKLGAFFVPNFIRHRH